MRYLLVILFIISLLNTLSAQDCGGRYASDVFSDVTLTEEIQYGQNTLQTGSQPNFVQTLYLDLYEPANDNNQNRPLIIWAFGGAFIIGTKKSPDLVILSNRLAKLGYVSASIDYRLSTEISPNGNDTMALRAALKGVHDMRAAIRFFYKSAANGNPYRIDTNRIFIGGVSAGAIVATQTAYLNETSEIPGQIVSDMPAFGGLEGNSGNPGYSTEVQALISLAGAVGDTLWVKPDEVPALGVHGTADNIVPYAGGTLTIFNLNLDVDGSAAVYQRLQNLGTYSEFVSFSGQGHTPFVTSPDPVPYMDTTFWGIRDFLFPLACTGSDTNSTTSIKDDLLINDPAFQLYPNPSQEAFQIQSNYSNRQGEWVRIIDIQGREVYNSSWEDHQELRFDTKGIYFVEITDRSGKTEQHRLIIQ